MTHTFESSPTLQEHLGETPPHEAIYQSCMANLLKYGCSTAEAKRILEPHRIKLDACYAEILQVSQEVGGDLSVLKADVDLAQMNGDILTPHSTVAAQMAEIGAECRRDLTAMITGGGVENLDMPQA